MMAVQGALIVVGARVLIGVEFREWVSVSGIFFVVDWRAVVADWGIVVIVSWCHTYYFLIIDG